MILDQIRDLLDVVLARFVWQVQAEVALRDHQVGGARQSAEDGHAIADGVTDHVGMSFATDVVENDSRNPDRGVETHVAVDQRRGTAGHRAGVDHENDGEVQQLGHLGGAPAVALALAAVEEAHDPFDHGGVGIGRRRREPLPIDVGPEHPAVEVAGGTAARMPVMERVDEVGADLEGLHGEAATPERPDQAERNRRLAYPAVGAANHDRAQRL